MTCCFISVVALLLAAGPTTKERSEEAAVRHSYDEFKQSLQTGDGKLAATLVSDELLRQYNEARRIALDSREVDLESLSQIQVLLVLQSRFLASEKTLRKMSSGADVFAWGIEQGLVKRDVVQALDLHEVFVEGSRARATLLKDGERVNDASFHFEKADGRWRFQMEKLTHAIEIQFSQLRQQAKKTKVELAVFLMERTYGQTIPREILDGPLVKD